MRRFQTKTYQIFSEKIGPRPIRLAFLSDLHNSCFGKENGQLLQAVESGAPDLVLIGGDMMIGEPSPRLDVVEELLCALVQRFPVYYTFGNHEYRLMEDPGRYGSGFQKLCERLQEQGIKILRNAHAQVDMGQGVPLVIWGWDGEKRFYRKLSPIRMEEGYLDRTLGVLDEDAYHILLAHNPQFGRSYFSWGADLILSGHYHGGVCRFSENRGLIAPNFHLFPAFCCGHFTKGRQHMVVSPGLGEHTVRLRVHDPRELIMIELVRGGGA
ncbi:MAG: phosphohydrolase [Lachnospiraceae bacterium]|nr:phosphohydrolase [Lachnospiraceae bacterium]